MPRYREEVKDYILNNVDIENVVSKYVTLKRVGANLKGLCPFHSEKTPSFYVSKNWQNFHCFGCSEGGDVISFIMKMENLDFISALEFIADSNGLDMSQFLDENARKVDSRLSKVYDINLCAAKYFRDNLKANSFAEEYLSDRGMSKEVISAFGLGYSLSSWDGLYKHLKVKGYSDDEILYSKLVRLSSNGTTIHDTFRNRIMIPIFDNRKRVVGFGARSLGNEMPKYINSSESDFFKKSKILYGQGISQNISRDKQCILVEGYMDVIKLNQFGFTNVFASMGTSLTEEQAHELSRKYKNLLFAYDMDDAGRKAIDRSLPLLEKHDIEIKVLELDKAKDPDEYINKFGIEVFKDCVDSAIDLYRYKIKRLKEGLDLKNASDRRVFIDKSIEYLKQLEDGVELSLYIQELSQETGIESSVIMTEYNKNKTASHRVQKNQKVLAESDKVAKVNTKTKLYLLEEKLFSICLSSKENFDFISESLSNGFKHQEFSLALLTLKEYYSSMENFSLNEAVDIMDLREVLFLDKYLRSENVEISNSEIQKLLIKREQEICLENIASLNSELNELLLYNDTESEVQARLKQSEIIKERHFFSTLLDAEKLI